MSNVSASELQVTLTDYDELCSPYDGRALRVRVSGDLAFLYIGTLTQNRDVEQFKWDDSTNSVGVDAEALYEALGSMLRRSDREAFDRLRVGTLPADHPSRRDSRLEVQVPGVRNRA